MLLLAGHHHPRVEPRPHQHGEQEKEQRHARRKELPNHLTLLISGPNRALMRRAWPTANDSRAKDQGSASSSALRNAVGLRAAPRNGYVPARVLRLVTQEVATLLLSGAAIELL